MFPFFWTGYTGMQVAQTLHAAIALLMIGLIIGHIYIGTIGMEGAFQAMWSGRVDANWAREHHRLWYETGASHGASPRLTAPGIVSFAAGAVIAVLLAVIMVGAFQAASTSTSEHAARSNPSVHLTDRATSIGK